MSETFHQVARACDIEEGRITPFVVAGWHILLCRQPAGFRAFVDRCPHVGAAFSNGGRIRAGLIMCPLHGARFSLEDGRCIGGEEYPPLKSFSCRVTDEGLIEVAVPDTPPGMEHLPVKVL